MAGFTFVEEFSGKLMPVTGTNLREAQFEAF